MVQIGRRGPRDAFLKISKNSQKSQNANFKILVNHFLRLCPLCIVKIDSIRTKLTEEIHFEVCPYRHNATTDATPPSTLQAPTRCGVPVAQRTTPFAVGKV